MKSSPLDLFTPIVESNKFHPNFAKSLSKHATGVRAVLENWVSGFSDRDGKFIIEFQTTYNSSFWELYLFAVLKHLGITIDFSVSSPDFVSSNKRLIVEAVIASNAYDDVPEWEKNAKNITESDTQEVWRQSIIRLSNALYGKVKKYRDNYAVLPHVKDKPFIIAISNYTRPDFNLQGDVPLQWLLYDIFKHGAVHKKNGAEVPLGLFLSDKFSDISGIFYSSVATFGKARALGNDVGNILFRAIRIKDNETPIMITAPKENYSESLCDGLRLFVNPFATNPLDINDFGDDGIRKFIADKNGDFYATCHPDGDLCMRMVQNVVPKKSL